MGTVVPEMKPPGSYEVMCDDLATHFQMFRALDPKLSVRMVGLLFARPETPFVAAEIVPSFRYFHRRSGAHINFYSAGFGLGWNFSMPDDEMLGFYSDADFNDFRRDIEKRSKWRYSGGADLLLTNARFDGNQARLDFSTAIAADLVKMKNDGAIQSVDSFFESIFQYAENQDGSDPTWGFSDRKGKHVAGSALKSFLISLLPKGIQDDAKRAFHFAVADVSI